MSVVPGTTVYTIKDLTKREYGYECCVCHDLIQSTKERTIQRHFNNKHKDVLYSYADPKRKPRSKVETQRVDRKRKREKALQARAVDENAHVPPPTKNRCTGKYIDKTGKIRQCGIRRIGGVFRCEHHPIKTKEDAEANGVEGGEWLEIKNSTRAGAGSGVFTKVVFQKDDFITCYEGDLVDNEDDVTNKDYALKVYGKPTIDGITTPILGKGVGSFINDLSYDLRLRRYPSRIKTKPNVRASFVDGKYFIKANDFIPIGTELSFSYGDEYWHRVVN